MNVDDFLDTAAEDSGSSEFLDLSKETPVAPPAFQKDPSQTTPFATSAPAPSQIPQPSASQENGKRTLQDAVKDVDQLISQENVQKAMDEYGKLVEMTRRIPPNNIGARAAMNQQLVYLHQRLQDKISSLRERFVNGSQNIIILLQSAKTALKANDMPQAKAIFTQITQRFSALPNEFADQKSKLQAEIIKAQLLLTTQEKVGETEQFKTQTRAIAAQLDAAEASILRGEHKAAVDICLKAEQAYHTLPEGYLDEKTKLYDRILKKKTAAEIALQIQLLQQEFQQTRGVQTSIQNIPMPKAPKSPVSESLAISNEPSMPHPASIPSVHFNEIDGALKRVKISKVRLDLVENRLASAENTCLELVDMFPNDADVLAVKELVEKHVGHAVMRHVAPVEHIEVTHHTQSEESDTASSVDFESQVGKLKVKLKKKPSHAKLSDAIIHRRISLARQQIQAGQLAEAKGTLSKVLEKAPDHEEAKKLFHLVS